MSRVLVVLATIATILGTATAAGAQTAIASDESPFRFQFEQSESPRGLAVEGTSTTHFHGASPTFGCRLTVSTRTGRASRPPRGGSWRRRRRWAQLFLRPRLGASGHVSPEFRDSTR